MKLPNKEELEDKLQLHINGDITIEVGINIYFNIFGQWFVIPKGFVSDGASLPFFLKMFLSPYNINWIFGAITHDYIYRTQFIPRDIADAIFREILKQTSNKFISYLFYLAVRIFGFIAWYGNSKHIEKYETAKYDLINYICNNEKKTCIK